jgi:hypothetical protein
VAGQHQFRPSFTEGWIDKVVWDRGRSCHKRAPVRRLAPISRSGLISFCCEIVVTAFRQSSRHTPCAATRRIRSRLRQRTAHGVCLLLSATDTNNYAYKQLLTRSGAQSATLLPPRMGRPKIARGAAQQAPGRCAHTPARSSPRRCAILALPRPK